VLIVDDHAGFRSFARAMLVAGGFVVVGEAETGTTALTATDRLDPDVVLLDIALPDIDGFEVCARMLLSGRDRPAVVLTSSRDAATYRARLDSSAARGFIPKVDLTCEALTGLVGSPGGRPDG
jgi:DNA-binding NarL/FixJ family response regulator